MLKIMKQTFLTFLIGGVACLQMVGHFTDSRTLRGLGLATGIAPYPKVFCVAKGYEPFAAQFTITDSNDTEIPLTAERYSQLQGPYQRRNVYGAALAYAPRLPDQLRNHLFEKILSDEFTLSRELDFSGLNDPTITITPRPGEKTDHYQYSLTKP